MSLGAETKGGGRRPPPLHAALSSGGAVASARGVLIARLTPKWTALEAWGRSTILRSVRRQAISSRLSAFTASSRQRPVKGKPSREAASSVAISKTVQPSRSARKSKGRSMGKLQLVRRVKATQSPGRSDGQTKATLGR